MLIRAGIIGPGGIGAVHADALRRLGVEISGVAASSPETSQRHAERLGVADAYPTAEALIANDRVDVVHVCTPNAQHMPQCRAALLAGKHVVSEKPLATSAADAAELLQLAETAGVLHVVCHNYRYYPMVQALRELVARAELGRLNAIHGTYLLEELLDADPSHWMLDPVQMGPALSLADVGIHWWDLVEHVTGQQIEQVLCETRAARPHATTGGEDTAAMVLRLNGGAIASGMICQAAPGHGNAVTIEVIGDRGAAAWDIRDPNRLVVRELGGVQRTLERATAPVAALGVGATLPAGQPEGQADAFRDLLARAYTHIRTGTPSAGTYPTFVDGLRGIQVLEALLVSAHDRRWTAIAARS